MREEAIRTARGFAERVKACFEKVSAVLIGSYARGVTNGAVLTFSSLWKKPMAILWRGWTVFWRDVRRPPVLSP
jgi:uncharacterized membrane protein